VVVGNGADPRALQEAGIDGASKLIIAVPEGFEAGAIAHRAHEMNAELTIFARAHSDEEVDHLRRHGVHHVVIGEREIANRLTELVVS
jgi:CPA2 family monovalent cation:H+ antiporter-2